MFNGFEGYYSVIDSVLFDNHDGWDIKRVYHFRNHHDACDYYNDRYAEFNEDREHYKGSYLKLIEYDSFHDNFDVIRYDVIR